MNELTLSKNNFGEKLTEFHAGARKGGKTCEVEIGDGMSPVLNSLEKPTFMLAVSIRTNV